MIGADRLMKKAWIDEPIRVSSLRDDPRERRRARGRAGYWRRRVGGVGGGAIIEAPLENK